MSPPNRSITPLTRSVLTLCALSLAALATLWITRRPHGDGTVLRAVGDFAHLRQADDSWLPMDSAFQRLRADPRAPIYQDLFFTRHIKFQYPPSALLAFEPWPLVHRLIPGLSAVRALALVSWVMTVVTIAFAVAIFERGVAGSTRAPDGSAAPNRFDTLVRRAALVGLGLTFYPLIKGYALGQIQVWLDAAIAGAIWAWTSERKTAAGVAIGLAALVKPQYALIVLWALWRGERRFLAGALGVVIPGLALSIALFGLANHVAYIDVLSYITQHGEAYYPNQSMNGLMNRLLGNGDNLTWHDESYAPYNAIVYATTLAWSILLIGAGFLSRRTPRGRSDVTALCIILLTSTMASPVAWEHHYGILLPIFAWSFALALRERTWGRATLPILALSYLVASNLIDRAQMLAPLPANALQSYLFLAAAILLAYLYSLPLACPERAPERDHTTSPATFGLAPAE
jgi:hypothetical protein